MSLCYLCPRMCGVDRTAGERGHCGAGALPRVAAVMLHKWEEPCISGTNGSGTVFFSGCPLKCVYCQNHEISLNAARGNELTSTELRNVFQNLISQGAHNINLVTGSHFADTIAEALSEPLGVPVIWNSSGYERVETLKMLEGKIDIYLTDFKYSDGNIAKRYSDAGDYPEQASKALLEMYRQTGALKIDSDGLIQRGIVLRHLILPRALQNTFGVIDHVRALIRPSDVVISLMSQFYIDHGNPIINNFPELNRRITKYEKYAAEEYMYNSGFVNGYVQDLNSANDGYIPSFSD